MKRNLALFLLTTFFVSLKGQKIIRFEVMTECHEPILHDPSLSQNELNDRIDEIDHTPVLTIQFDQPDKVDQLKFNLYNKNKQLIKVGSIRLDGKKNDSTFRVQRNRESIYHFSIGSYKSLSKFRVEVFSIDKTGKVISKEEYSNHVESN